jgi:pyrroline-5-carboxylate reductase
MGGGADGLLLVGCGKMGSAFLERAGRGPAGPVFSGIRVVDPAPQPENLKSIRGLKWLASPGQIDAGFKPALVVVAVKPQHMADALPAYAGFRDSVFLSIAAGTTLARLEQLLGHSGHAIIRAMPNLPASIGQGITAVIANARVTAAQRALGDDFLKAVGEVIWLDDEILLDGVTAFAGGPAFVFALCESMAKAGEAFGFPPAMAMQLARRNVIGSGALLAQSLESAEALRRAVTSAGGTTEAALKHILTEHGLDEMMLKAMTAGARRAKELSR